MPYDLLFANPVFHKGENVTVRKGPKHFQRLDMGDTVRLVNAETGEVEGTGEVTQLYLSALRNIPDHLLPLEHDPACRTAEGLLEVLRGVYEEVDEGTTVTTIIFDA